MFTKEERLFIWKKVYEEIERLEDGKVIIYHFTQKRKTIYICTKYHTGYHQYPLPVAQK